MSNELTVVIIIGVLVALPIIIFVFVKCSYMIMAGIQALLNRLVPDKNTDSYQPTSKMLKNTDGKELTQVDGAVLQKVTQDYELKQKALEGANWFYWIAGLSIINYLVAQSGGNLNFIVGLGITQLIAGMQGIIGGGAIFLLNIGIAIVFVLFGWVAKRKHLWGFIVGMIVYALDGLIFLLVDDYLSIGFHIFALYCIYKGFRVSRQSIKCDTNSGASI